MIVSTPPSARTPAGFASLLEVTIARAQELLEETRLSVENIAAETGFGAAPLLRHHFLRAVGITPTGYRRQHAGAGA